MSEETDISQRELDEDKTERSERWVDQSPIDDPDDDDIDTLRERVGLLNITCNDWQRRYGELQDRMIALQTSMLRRKSQGEKHE
jgi:hypothetical protein